MWKRLNICLRIEKWGYSPYSFLLFDTFSMCLCIWKCLSLWNVLHTPFRHALEKSWFPLMTELLNLKHVFNSKNLKIQKYLWSKYLPVFLAHIKQPKVKVFELYFWKLVLRCYLFCCKIGREKTYLPSLFDTK